MNEIDRLHGRHVQDGKSIPLPGEEQTEQRHALPRVDVPGPIITESTWDGRWVSLLSRPLAESITRRAPNRLLWHERSVMVRRWCSARPLLPHRRLTITWIIRFTFRFFCLNRWFLTWIPWPSLRCSTQLSVSSGRYRFVLVSECVPFSLQSIRQVSFSF